MTYITLPLQGGKFARHGRRMPSFYEKHAWGHSPGALCFIIFYS